MTILYVRCVTITSELLPTPQKNYETKNYLTHLENKTLNII